MTLTPRESQLLSLLANNPGMPQKLQIEAMGVAMGTLDGIALTLKRKLGASNTAELAVLGVLSGYRQNTVVLHMNFQNAEHKQIVAEALQQAMVKVLEAHA